MTPDERSASRARAHAQLAPVMLQMWGGAAALVAASVLIGHALTVLGCRCRAAGPTVGMAVLIALAGATIQLPGRAITAAVIVVIVIAAAAVVVARVRPDRERPRAGRGWGLLRGRAVRLIGLGVPATVIVLSAFGAAVPFLANGHVGLLGVSLDNDTAAHLTWAQGLRTPATVARYGINHGYPLGPHSLVATLATALGLRLDMAMTALLVATVILTALVGAAALRREAAWKQVVAGVLSGLFYLVAAYYAEGSFKEPLMGLFLLAMVVHLEGLLESWGEAQRRPGWQAFLPLGVIWAGATWTYSYTAVAWLGGTLVIWAVAEALVHPAGLRRWGQRALAFAVPVTVAVGVMVLLLLPTAARIVTYVQSLGLSPAGNGAITASNLGNLAHPLTAWEALGIWTDPDFRIFPANLFHQGELSALALGVLLLGLAWSLGRRELVMPAAIAACGIIYWHSNGVQSPYVTAKALVIAGPVVAVCGVRGLLGSNSARLPAWVALPRFALACVFVYLACHSSYEALRNEPVWPPEPTNELLALDRQVRGQYVLFLGSDDYASWIFADSNMSTPNGTSVNMAQASGRPGKPWQYGTDLDFDSVDPNEINRFAWAITTTATYASQAPRGFVLVRRLRMYELWKRIAPTVPRSVIETSGSPGAVLNCHTAAGKALSHRNGVAAVMTTPVVVPLSPLPVDSFLRTRLMLPAGKWDLSLSYVSPLDVNVDVAGGYHWRMPAYLDRPGPFFYVGSITSTGAPEPVLVTLRRPSAITGPSLLALPTALAATRAPETRTLVPLREACGRYVDWYRLD